jgi:hypothetical protein
MGSKVANNVFLSFDLMNNLLVTSTIMRSKVSNGHSPQIRENGELLVRMWRGESHFSQKWRLANVGESGEYLVNGLANVGEFGKSAQHGSPNVGEFGESAQHGLANVGESGESAQHGSAQTGMIR